MRKPAIVLTALLLTASLFLAACGERGTEPSSAAPPSAASAASEPADASSSETGDAQTSAPESLSDDANDPETGEGASVVIPIETDSPEFDAKFRENPIDAAYVKESAEAVSTLDMVAVCEKYAALWEKEIEAGMEKLLSLATDDREVYQKEQEDWELLSYPAHRQFHDYIRALNHLYLQFPQLHYDYGFGNFEWADLNTSGRAVFSIRRKTADAELLAILHFDCDPAAPYRVSLPPFCELKLLLHSGQKCFGGAVEEPGHTFQVLTDEEAPENRLLEIMLGPYDCLVFYLQYADREGAS